MSIRFPIILIVVYVLGCNSPIKADVVPFIKKPINLFTSKSPTAYPNPFNELTTIFYSPIVDEFIKVRLYNNKGRLISKIFEDNVEKGAAYQFELDGRNLNPGTYYYTIETNESITHERIDLVR